MGALKVIGVLAMFFFAFKEEYDKGGLGGLIRFTIMYGVILYLVFKGLDMLTGGVLFQYFGAINEAFHEGTKHVEVLPSTPSPDWTDPSYDFNKH